MLRFLISLIFSIIPFASHSDNYTNYLNSVCDYELQTRFDQCMLTSPVTSGFATCFIGNPYNRPCGTVHDIFLVYNDHCPSGTTLVPDSGVPPRCLCSAGYNTFSSSGSQSCACEDGFVPDFDGGATDCDRPTPDCGDNGFSTLADGSKICNPDCPQGQQSDGQGGCEPITCPAGFELVGNDCLPECTGGRTRSGTSCLCASSTTWNGSSCIVDVSGCPAGQVFNGVSCVAANSTPPTSGTGGTGSGSGGSGGTGGTGSSGGSGGYTGGGGLLGTGTGAASFDCSTRPACSDDSVECAQLIQSWIATCANNQFSESDLSDDFGDAAAAGDLYDDSGGGGNGWSDEIAGVMNQNGAGGTCPAPQSINLHFGNFEVSYQPFCDLAVSLSPLVILLFSLMAARVIHQAFQG